MTASTPADIYVFVRKAQRAAFVPKRALTALARDRSARMNALAPLPVAA